jgi:phosphatidylserine/phosphatidylglycerophosphate/cardiolipin synthase-like enzyme
LLLDNHAFDGNALTANRLLEAGGECRVLGSDARAAHWKLIVIDSHRVAVGTGNLIWRDAPRDAQGRFPPDCPPLHGTREWWILSDGATSSHAAAGFEAAWQLGERPPARWQSPADEVPPAAVGVPAPQVGPLTVRAPDCCAALVDGARNVALAERSLIRQAANRLFITVPYVHAQVPAVRALLDDCDAAVARGVDVRLLLGERQRSTDMRELEQRRLTVRQMDPQRSTRGHAKGVVADESVLLGSSNWSNGGLSINWEAAVMVRSADAARYYADAFTRDWDASPAL